MEDIGLPEARLTGGCELPDVVLFENIFPNMS